MTQTLRAVIVDDEALARAVVKEHLQAHPEVELVAECANGFEAVKAVQEQKPDLLFLDIQMPKLDGFEVLELLEPAPSVIFVTAYDQYALKAFEAHAVDYLLKPFSKQRFDEALIKAMEKARAKAPLPVAPAELSAAGRPWPLERLVVRDNGKVTLVPMAKLDYVQAQDDYVELNTEGRGILKQQTLASLESQLDPAKFLRIHRSFILNMDRLARLEQLPSESWVAVLTDGRKLPVSKTGYQRVKEVLEK
jgi:two-component system LytT family response regulator